MRENLPERGGQFKETLSNTPYSHGRNAGDLYGLALLDELTSD